MTAVSMPTAWSIATFARRLSARPAGTTSRKPVRTKLGSPAPTRSSQSVKYGKEAQAKRASLSRS